MSDEGAELYRDPSGAPAIVWSPPHAALDRDATTPDVSRLPGAELVAAVAYGDGSNLRVRAGCARGPSDRFAKGIEDVLFDRATAFALAAEALSPTEMAIVEGRGTIDDGLVEQQRSGKAAGDTGVPERAIAMRHLLTFAGKDRDVLLCTVLCVGPDAAVTCNDVTRSLRVVGTHAPPPPPNLVTRSVFFAAAHPMLALGALVGAFVLVSAFIVRRRPRARPRYE